MFLSFTQKSILFATAIVFGISNLARSQSNTQEVTIDFEGWVGQDEFVCGESYDNVGVNETTITPTDFRLYVSDVALIDEDGNAIPLELEQDGQWQYQNTALLDFEDGTRSCDNGTPQTNTTIVGTVPEGDYQSLQFTLGVPENLNHEDAAIAPSPLNLTSMWWNWQGGYKFLRVDLETDSAIANASVNDSNNVQINRQIDNTREQPNIFQNPNTDSSHSSDTSNTEMMRGGSNSYLIHIGSTGCQDSAQSDLFGCANPNRSTVVLEDFDPDDNVVIVDLAELLYETDLAINEANTPNGCMSSPEDGDCLPIMTNLGLTFDNVTSQEQNFFFVE